MEKIKIFLLGFRVLKNLVEILFLQICLYTIVVVMLFLAGYSFLIFMTTTHDVFLKVHGKWLQKKTYVILLIAEEHPESFLKKVNDDDLGR